jgi:hypothetical protein
MRYACLVYFDPKKAFDHSPESQAILDSVGAYSKEMRENGTLITEGPLQLPDQAMTVSVRDGKTVTKDGPFMETKEVLGGFGVIEARDLNDAVRIAAANPMAKFGYVEVRPFVDFSKPRPKL